MRARVTPQQLVARIRRLARNSEPESLEAPLRAVAAMIETDILRAFDKERTPGIVGPDEVQTHANKPWASLAPSTIAHRGRKAAWAEKERKQGKRKRFTMGLAGKIKKLQDEGLMRESIVHDVVTTRNAAIARAGVVGASVFYAIFHQYGTKKMPARPFVGMARDTLKRAVKLIRQHITRGRA